MPGLSQYRPQPGAPAPANIDEMLQNLDTGASAPSTLGQTRPAMPAQPQQGANPWLEWLMNYLQTKQPGQPR